MAKQNDWIIATMNNPELDTFDFKNLANMSLDNTQLLSKDAYLNSTEVRNNQLFQDENGNFSEVKFSKFYDEQARNFKEFSTIEDDFQYGFWDSNRPKNGRVRNINLQLQRVSNPDHITIGLTGINEVRESDKSKRELAQDSDIVDPETGKSIGYSLNDVSLFSNPIDYIKSLFGDPIVYATYDEDTEDIDPITGNKVKHYKGEFKVNDEGEYYTELLKGRSLIGKEVVSGADYLTSENSLLNSIDFLDSDDKQKSVGGTIAKGVFSLLPLFIPYVREAYGYAMVTRELAKTLPMGYGIVSSLIGAEDIENSTLNTIAGYANKFTTSTSDYAQNKTFAFENFANLAVDVALQWSQQKTLANGISKLQGRSNKALEAAEESAKKLYKQKATQLLNDKNLTKDRLKELLAIDDINDLDKIVNSGLWAKTQIGNAALNKIMPQVQKQIASSQRLGADLSLVYMALISNTDVYDSIRQISDDPREAALIALGSTIGMFSVDKYLGLGEMFFEQDLSRKALREAVKKSTNEVIQESAITGATNVATKKGFLAALDKGINLGRRAVNYFDKAKEHSLGFFGKSIGEGLEEVSEELVTDLNKKLAEALGSQGILFSQDDYGSFEGVGERYLMSFLGGSFGGAMFYGVDLYQNRNNKAAEMQSDLTDLIRQGRKEDILKELKEQHDKGVLGNTNLSFQTVEDDQGNKTYLTADENRISQNDYVYNTLVKLVDQLDLILNSNQINLTDDEVFDKMVQGEYRAKQLSSFLSNKDNLEQFKNLSYTTRYLKDFKQLTQQIIDQESKIEKFLAETPDTNKRGAKFQADLQALMDEKEKLIQQKDYLFGEGSLGYVEKTLFAMDQNLSSAFFAINFDQYVRSYYGFDAEMLENPEFADLKQQIKKQYELYKQEKAGKNLDIGFEEFKQLQQIVNPNIQPFTTLNVRSSLEKLQQEITDLPIYGWDSKMEFESDAEYNDRNQREGETDNDYKIRKSERQRKINEYTISKLKTLLGESIDQSTARRLVASLNMLTPEAFNQVLETQMPMLFQNVRDSIQMDGVNVNGILDIIIANLRESRDIDNYNSIFDIIREELKNQLIVKYDENRWVKDSGLGKKVIDEEENITYMPTTYQDIIDTINNLNQTFPDDVLNGFIDEGYENFRDQFLSYAAEQGVTDITDEKKIKIAYIFTKDKNPNLSQLNLILFRAVTNAVPLTDAGTLWMDENSIAQTVNNDVNWNLLHFGIEDFIKKLHKDVFFETAYTLGKTATYKSPILPVIQQLLTNGQDLETLLSNIHQQYLSGLPSEFQLTDSQLESLKEILDTIAKLKIAAQAASVNESYQNPTGHNKMINEFVNNHKDVYKNFELLPELDNDQSQLIFTELLNYETEIRTWIAKSESNSQNRSLRQIKTQENYIKSILKFYTDNKHNFKLKFTVDDQTIEEDLFEGIDSIVIENKWIDLVKVEELIHSNYIKLRNKGYSQADIIKALLNTKVFNIINIVSGTTSKLDENITSNTITDYDKFIEIVSNFSDDQNINLTYFERLKAFISDPNNTDVAPLFAQEHAYKITNIAIQDKQLVKTALTEVQKIAATQNIIIPVVAATTIVGVAGSGKTFANSRLACNLGENTWLCGPNVQQVNGLKKNLPRGTIITGENSKLELLTKVFNSSDKAKQFLADIDAGKCPANFKTATAVDDVLTFTLENTDDIATISNPPKNIVIDEITHFSTPEILAISAFCDKNNINLILIGDDGQSGKYIKYKDKYILNADRECILTWRTPKLLISLRENNIQKTYNLNQTLTPLHDLLYCDKTTEQTVLDKILNGQDKPSITLKYNLGEELNGEYITSGLNKELISKLKGKVGFIGDKNSVYQELVDAGLDVEAYNEDEVQGKEFEFVVVNINWKKNFDGYMGMLTFYQQLYTMISRSQKGTIIIDNNISDVIKTIEDKTVGKLASIKDSAESLRKKQTPEIDAIIDYLKSLPANTINLPAQPDNPPIPPTQPDNTIIPPDIPPENLDPEPGPVDEPETKDDSNDVKDQQEQEDAKSIQFGNIVRVYGNASYSGIDLDSNKIINSNQDLGIFLTGTKLSRSKEKRARQIDDAVRNLLKLKGMFLYSENNDYASYLTRFKTLEKLGITKEDLNNTKFYLVSRTPSQTTKLVGLTSLMQDENIEDDKRAIGSGRKVVTIEARITHGDKTYNVTLGAVADPNTWLRADDSPIVQKYKDVINSFTKKEQEMEIEAPQFSAFQEIIPMETNDQQQTKSRLASLDSETKSLWQVRTQYAVVSQPKVLTLKDCQNLGLNASLSGKKAVVFVSNNLFLNPEQLEDIYITNREKYLAAGKTKTSTDVRMIVLSSVGVSFNSLCDNSFPVFNENITATIDDEGNKKVPFKIHGMAIRMYEAMWNFRADLLNYLDAYKTFLENEFNNDEDSLYNYLIKEHDYYQQYLSENNVRYVDEKTFRDYLKTKVSDYENYEKIWHFNEVTLKDYKRFRLGYSPDGAYIRNIKFDVNEKGEIISGPYANRTVARGIYIAPKTARNYATFIETIFTQIFDKAITLEGVNHRTRINRSEQWYKALENKEVTENIEFNFGKNKAKITSKATLKNAVFALVQTAKTLYSNQAKNLRYIIFPVKLGKEEISLDNITSILFNDTTGSNQQFIVNSGEEGYEPFTVDDNGQPIGKINKSFDNLMSLIFHGKLSRHVKEGFEGNNQYDTLAEFPFGFFSDIMVVNKKGGNNMYEAIYNLALLETDTVPAFPQFTVRFVTPKQPSTEPITKPSTETITLTPEEQQIQNTYLFLKNITDIKTVKDRITQFRNILYILETTCPYIANELATYKKINSLDDLIKEANKIARDRLNQIRETANSEYAINSQLDAAIKIEKDSITTIESVIESYISNKLTSSTDYLKKLELKPLDELNTANTYQIVEHLYSGSTEVQTNIIGNFTIILNDQNELVITEVLNTDNIVETTETTEEIEVTPDVMVEDIKNIIKEVFKPENIEDDLIDDDIKETINLIMKSNNLDYNIKINTFTDIDQYKNIIINSAENYIQDKMEIEIQISDNIKNNIKCNIH